MNKYSKNDVEPLRKALVRRKYLKKGEPMPKPYQRASGVAGKSRVYFLFIPRGSDSGIHLVAKFDRQDRAKKEWKHTEELRRVDLPLAAILPINDWSQDGVTLYRAAEGITESGRCTDLKGYILNQMCDAPENCVKALDFVFSADALTFFYRREPGAARDYVNGQVLHWSDVFPQLKAWLEEVESTIKRNWPEFGNALQHLDLPNPLVGIDSRLSSLTKSVMLSRVHGDLNLSNMIVTTARDNAPTGVRIIDLAECKPYRVTATDFARLESEFWQEAYVDIYKFEKQVDSVCLSNFVEARNYLDGRTTDLPRTSLPRLGNCFEFVYNLRKHADACLSGSKRDYMLVDYFYCLFFQSLSALTFRSVSEHPTKTRIAFLGSALAIQTLQDLEAGRYSKGAHDD